LLASISSFEEPRLPDWLSKDAYRRLYPLAHSIRDEFPPQSWGLLSRLFALGFRLSTPAIHQMDNYARFAYGIEIRHPFLDRRIIEFALALPYTEKDSMGISKLVLRDAMKGVLPESIRTRLDKAAFNPLASIGLHKNAVWIKDIFNRSKLVELGYADAGQLRHHINLAIEQSKYADRIYGPDIRSTLWSLLDAPLVLEHWLHQQTL